MRAAVPEAQVLGAPLLVRVEEKEREGVGGALPLAEALAHAEGVSVAEGEPLPEGVPGALCEALAAALGEAVPPLSCVALAQLLELATIVAAPLPRGVALTLPLAMPPDVVRVGVGAAESEAEAVCDAAAVNECDKLGDTLGRADKVAEADSEGRALSERCALGEPEAKGEIVA